MKSFCSESSMSYGNNTHQQTPSTMLIKKNKQLTCLNDEHLEKTSTRNMVPKYEKLIEEKKCIISLATGKHKNFPD
jgi:hypothetical protein